MKKTNKVNPIQNNPVAKFAGQFCKASVVQSKKAYKRTAKHKSPTGL